MERSRLWCGVSTLAAVLTMMAAGGDASAQGCLYYENFPHVEGILARGADKVAQAWPYLYTTDETTGLSVIDVSDASRPVLMGTCDTPGDARDVAVSGGFAYVADGSSGLQVINVNNPTAPTIVGTCVTGDGAAGVATAGNYAYVAAASAGLQVINISNPAAPVIVGSVLTSEYASAVAVLGDFAYVVDSGSLYVINVSNSSSPWIVGQVEVVPPFTYEHCTGVTVASPYAYVTTRYSTGWIVDISNPTTPAILGNISNLEAAAVDVAVSGGTVYVLHNWIDDGLAAMEISNPLAPQLLYAVQVGGWGDGEQNHAVAVLGDYAYVTSNSGLYTVFLGGGQEPPTIGQCEVPLEFSSRSVATSGGYAYAVGVGGDEAEYLAIFDIRNPASPVNAGMYPTSGDADVAISGHYLYLAGVGVIVMDISNPTSPVQVAAVDVSGYATALAIAGNYLYVACIQGPYDGGLKVVDISNPTLPTIVGSVVTGAGWDSGSYGIAVSGGYAYVAAGNNGLQVVDVSNPASPVFVAVAGDWGVYGVAVSGDYAYVARYNADGNHGWQGLEVIDVSNPSAPVTVGEANVGVYCKNLVVSDGYAYVADSYYVHVVDIANPASPSYVGRAGDGVLGVQDLVFDGSRIIGAGPGGAFTVLYPECGGPGPVCEVSPGNVAFGAVPVGSAAERSFTLRNTGGHSLTGGIREACAPYSIVSGFGPFSLASGASLPVTVRFSPTTAGTSSCTIETGAALCSDVECTGTGWVPFTDAGATIPGTRYPEMAWGDYDNDGDLDVLLAGIFGGSPLASRIYRNDGATFTDIEANLQGVIDGGVTWGDYDNDEDLDILISGFTGTSLTSLVYRNDGGLFVDINAGLPELNFGTVAWGDYDNDGDLDILLAGAYNSSVFNIYRNDSGVFTDIGAGLPGLYLCSAAWGDYDNDGDLDILLAGLAESGRISRVYRNHGGTFTDAGAGLLGLDSSSAAWGDYDNDGDLDILLSGSVGTALDVTRVYRNDGGAFTDIGAGLLGISSGSAAWGDYDNDGDLDILLAGDTSSTPLSRVYRNDGGAFTDISAGLLSVSNCKAAWGDYDNDGDLDIFLAGSTYPTCATRIYRNNCLTPNTLPNPPTDLWEDVTGKIATFHWDAATDEETPSTGLTYNLRIGTTRGGSEVTSGMAAGSTGYRRVVQLGNTDHRRSWTVTLPSGEGRYYWGAQALDGAFAGSAFAEDSVFVTTTSAMQVVGDFNGPNSEVDMTQVEPGVWVTDSLAVSVGCHLLVFRTNHDEGLNYGSCSGVDSTCQVPLAGPICRTRALLSAAPAEGAPPRLATAIGKMYFPESGVYSVLVDEQTDTYAFQFLMPVATEERAIPTTFRFLPASPNPSSGSTRLAYELAEGAQVTIRVYDVSGRLVRVVENAKRAPGNYAATWDGKDSTGRRVAAGVYLSQIRAGNQAETQLVVLLAD